MAAEVLEFCPPADSARELARCLGGYDASVGATLEAAIPAARYDQLLSTAASCGLAFRGNDEEAEGVFSLMMSLLGQVEASQQVAIVERIADAAAAAVDRAPLRLRILTSIYNSLGEGAHKPAKLSVLMKLIRFAADAKLLELLTPFFAGAASWPAKWALTPEQSGTLYLLISRSLERAGQAEEAQAFLIRYLSTLEGASDAALAAARDSAVLAALNFIKAPTVSQKSNLARLAAVRALSRDATHSRLYSLLDIFSHRTLSEYSAFQASNGPYLAELGVDNARSTETMRLLTLCSLASAKHVLSYAEIAAALQVSETEVEPWVVRAVGAGLVDARMDQAGRTVSVSRSVQREFTGQQWASLKDRLDAWAGHVDAMLGAIGHGGASSGAGSAARVGSA